MKIKARDNCALFWDSVIADPFNWLRKHILYSVELGHRNGFEINGAPGCRGRFGTLETLAELASKLDGPDDDVSFALPSTQPGSRSHRINIWGTNAVGDVLLEFVQSGVLGGSYEKTVPIENVLAELCSLPEAQEDISANGYVWVEWL